MRPDNRLRRWLAPVGAGAGGRAGGLAGPGAALVGSTLAADDRAQLWALLGPQLPLLLLAAVLLVGAVRPLVQAVYRRWVAAPPRLLEQAQALLTADEPAPLKPPPRRRHAARDWPVADQRPAAQRAPAARRHRARRSPKAAARRAGAQPARGADVGADAERRGVQPRRPHPALQQPRAAAVPGPVGRAAAGRRRRADRPRARRSTPCSTASSWPMRWRSVQQRLARGAAARRRSSSPSTPRRPAAARADGAGARSGRRRRQSGAAGKLGGFVLMLDNITRDYERDARAGPAAARADRGPARVAGQSAGGGRAARRPGPGRADARALPRPSCATRRAR